MADRKLLLGTGILNCDFKGLLLWFNSLDLILNFHNNNELSNILHHVSVDCQFIGFRVHNLLESFIWASLTSDVEFQLNGTVD